VRVAALATALVLFVAAPACRDEQRINGGTTTRDTGTVDTGAGGADGSTARDATGSGGNDGATSMPENDDRTCSDGLDNDGDRFTDCDDFDCTRSSAVTVCGMRDGGMSRVDAGPGTPENTDQACSDGVDNDNDRFVDCEDFDCTRTAGVTVCGTRDGGGNGMPEDTDALCSDGVDNDGDRFIDCMDFNCSRNPAVTVCGARDGGGNGMPEDTDALCSDGLDNDGDRFTDCMDFNCSRNPAVTVCAGSDGGTTPRDGGTGMPEDTDALCSDGLDNDGDRFIDCMDFNCSRNPAVTVCAGFDGGTTPRDGGGNGMPENTDALCSDGLDNDGDRFIDCMDFDCSRNPAVTVCP
jgi:hypothetical protein